jgi:hypothetical protein
MPPKNLGALERPKDPRDVLLGTVQAPVQIPATFIPDVQAWLQRNYQSQTPFCGEHAGSHFKAILDNVESGAVERKSPRYGAIKLKSPSSPVYDGVPIAEGTTMTGIFKWLEKVGADDYEPLENDVTLPLAAYCDPSAVTPAMDANAATSVISSYAFGATDFASLCQAIYQNKAVIILIKCDDGFWGTSTPTFTTPTYGHFVVAYGYDGEGIYVVDSAEPENQFAFKHILGQYITPAFFFEAGTAIDLPPAVKQALTTNTPVPASVTQALSTGQLSLAGQILQDIEAALALIKQEI